MRIKARYFRGMKNYRKAFVFLFAFAQALFLNSSHADTLMGNIVVGANLSCNFWNTSGRVQQAYQIEYNWTCNNGPNDPYQNHYAVTGCIGTCYLRDGQIGVSYNGPSLSDCKTLVIATCNVYTTPFAN